MRGPPAASAGIQLCGQPLVVGFSVILVLRRPRRSASGVTLTLILLMGHGRTRFVRRSSCPCTASGVGLLRIARHWDVAFLHTITHWSIGAVTAAGAGEFTHAFTLGQLWCDVEDGPGSTIRQSSPRRALHQECRL